MASVPFFESAPVFHRPRLVRLVRLDLVASPRPGGVGACASEIAGDLTLPGAEDPVRRIDASGSDPVTPLLPVRGDVPTLPRGARDTLALRVTYPAGTHAGTGALLERFAGPLAATSVEPAVRRPVPGVRQIRQTFRGGLDLRLSGGLGAAGGPSVAADGSSSRGRD